MAFLDASSSSFGSSGLGTQLTQALMAPDIVPGSQPSYQLCKILYEYHPLGKKMVDSPIAMAQSQRRDITVSRGPEQTIRDAFEREWRALRADKVIAQLARVARIYGTGALVVLAGDDLAADPLDLPKLAGRPLGLNVLDPLNTSGSMNTAQSLDANAIGFQRSGAVVVNGRVYHPSRTCVLQNEAPLYLSYTSSAFGFVGRSVYQRALYPMRTFVQSMRTDDLVVRKAGVIVAKIKTVGSMVDNVVSKVIGAKRALAKEALTDDVLSIGDGDAIESMNLTNLEGPYTLARKNVVENVALSADMPAKILNSETFAEGFGEGTEDAKNVARFVDGVREDMQPAYDFLDQIVQYRAWTPAFYEVVQAQFPEEYEGVDYETAFYGWRDSFSATWPNLLVEPDSEKVKTSDVRIKGVIAVAEVLLPLLDPENRGALLSWLTDNLNNDKVMFSAPLMLDPLAFAEYEPPQVDAEQEPSAPAPFSAADSAVVALGDAARALGRRS